VSGGDLRIVTNRGFTYSTPLKMKNKTFSEQRNTLTK